LENNQEEFQPRIPLLYVWPRRQEIQRVLAGPALIKEVKRTNTVIVRTIPTMTLPTVTVPTNMEMDIKNTFRNTSDNYDKMRGQTSTSSKQSSKISSISSTVSLVIYYKRIEINNNLENDIDMEPIKMTQLLYIIPRGQVNQVSTAADSNNNMINQCVLIKGLPLNSQVPLILMIMSLTFNYHMTLTDLWNPNYEIAISILFYYASHWNTLLLILKALRNLWYI